MTELNYPHYPTSLRHAAQDRPQSVYDQDLFYLVHDSGFVRSDEWLKDQATERSYSPVVRGTYRIVSQHDPTHMRPEQSLILAIEEMVRACPSAEPQDAYNETMDYEELLDISGEVGMAVQDYGFIEDTDGETNTWTLYEEV